MLIGFKVDLENNYDCSNNLNRIQNEINNKRLYFSFI